MSEVIYPENLDQDGQKLIEALLERNPNKRPDFDDIKGHPWMSDVEFNPIQLKNYPMPDWIVLHASRESKPKTVRRSSMASIHNHKKDLSLSLFIRDICTQMVDVRHKTEAESAAARWMANPSPQTVELFKGWNFMSDEARSMEVNANRDTQMGFLKRMISRRGTSDW